MKFKAFTLGMLMVSAGVAQAATVQEVFNADMLGTNQRYFESIAGIPRESDGNDHVFRVKNCRITATIKSDKVTALHMDLVNGCEADLRSFIGEDAPKPGQKITPSLFGSDLKYSAECLSMCGNAYDPSAYALWTAPRSGGGLEVLLGFVLAGSEALDAAEVWTKKMKKEAGEDYVMNTKFNCDARFNSVAEAAFKNVAATSVTIGYGLPTQPCH